MEKLIVKGTNVKNNQRRESIKNIFICGINTFASKNTAKIFLNFEIKKLAFTETI